MRSLSRLALATIIAMASFDLPRTFAQVPTAPATTDAQVYEKYRAWVTKQPPEVQRGDPLEKYRSILAAEGVAASEIDRQIRLIKEEGQRLEIELWNRVLTSPTPVFNVKPNAFLVEMTRGVPPGSALDVGMGQGRNALYLAQQGWTVTGFDPADKAVALAQEQAARLGVKLTTVVARDDQFDFGDQKWDLIVLSYVGLRPMIPRVYQALKPGGLVIIEAFHRDATKVTPIGNAVVFDTNELLKLFERFRVVRYEDTEGTSDFGMRRMRLVRLCAQKQ